jgi:hypothetical protein
MVRMADHLDTVNSAGVELVAVDARRIAARALAAR